MIITEPHKRPEEDQVKERTIEDKNFRKAAITKTFEQCLPLNGHILSVEIVKAEGEEKSETWPMRSDKEATVRVKSNLGEVLTVYLMGVHPDGRDLFWHSAHLTNSRHHGK
jgi:hypothetical protein